MELIWVSYAFNYTMQNILLLNFENENTVYWPLKSQM